MNATVFPTSTSEWIALFAALTPLVIWAGSSLTDALTSREERRAAEWRRLQELALILYNPDHSFGGWAQDLAAAELVEISKRNKTAAELQTSIVKFWQRSDQSTEAALRLAALLSR